jgi:hypothetical protein
MRRRAGRHLALAGVLLASLSVTAYADAACSGRPTDASGFQGYAYDVGTAKSFAGARVRVHYAISGTNTVDPTTTRPDAVPDTVALAAQIGDTALLKYAEMGFKQPPPDSACASSGGDDKLDIYLVAFTGADGQTVPESCAGRACTSFMLVESTFSGRGYPTAREGFETVVAHELFHAVQNGYDSELDRFWAEGTAQWAMKAVYPGLSDFEGQLPAFFKDPTRSLDTQPSGVTAGFLYGSAVWPLFLSLRHGPDTVREIFERELDGTKAIAATEAVLGAKSSSLAADYPLFGAWNAATKTLAGEGGYPDAAKYPGVKTEALTEGATGITSGLAYYAYRGTLDAPSAISLETDGARNAGLAVPVVGGKAQLANARPLPADMEGEVLVIVAGTTTKKTDAPFTLHLGAPDPGASSPGGASETSGGAGDGGDGGGCAVTPARSSGGLDALAALAVALAGVASARGRTRPRKTR